ncbi:zinc finger BED domain-containing protein RICESLEEPER 2-like [Prosopis cineraria]|uniref:zinc finger BED domain-containing protein RICESLEEPER 2-like n=1 Tax=Prosopis cineraria TaxID=364024 RepID=UPI00240F2259|nr:zinc finger BED domain-containing protein RICESLEEPER 2-like [Prosopis cineraria]
MPVASWLSLNTVKASKEKSENLHSHFQPRVQIEMADQSSEQNQGHTKPEPSHIPCQDTSASDESVDQTQGQYQPESSSSPCQDANGAGNDVSSTSDAATDSSMGENILEHQRALAKYVICHEMPFWVVEGSGFEEFWYCLKSGYRTVPTGLTIAGDCFNLFREESKKLKEFLEKSCSGVCLTAETWTSIHDFKYVSLTAHFIDEHWRLQKRMLNFSMIEDHEGDTIGRTIKKCLLKWGIKKLFTLTVDDARSNVITHLKEYLKDWNGLTCDGDYLHVRCYAHILNKVVNDGLMDLSDSISAIRNAIQYVRFSSERLETFKSSVKKEKIDSESLVRLDIASRWNSTYMMLERAIKFQKVFERMENEDKEYKTYFKEDMDEIGPPSTSDWSKVSAFVQVLKVFYDITLRLSRSLHMTPNECFHDITFVRDMLQQNIAHEDPLIRDMAKNIKCKYDEHWGKPNNLNPVFAIQVVLDPRYKLEYVNLIFENLYLDTDLCEAMKRKVKDALYRLYEEYSLLVVNDNGESSRTDIRVSNGPTFVYTNLKEKVLKKMRLAWDSKTELERYLTADLVDDHPSFDILIWWKQNAAKYKVLSLIARDVLAVPASSSCEYAFRPGERVLKEYQSNLPAKMVEALLCTKSWLTAKRVKLRNGDFNKHEEPEEGDSDFNDDEVYLFFE